MYSPQLIDHFEHPRNVGAVLSPDAQARVENPACGDVLTLSLRIDAGRIVEAKYQVKGCVAAIGCGSALTELLAGRSIQDARGLDRAAIQSAVGGLPPASEHASHLAWDALQGALRHL
ncbi:MAG: iron-sulfur cluster assembly scaffold protein [Candidatus Koribacter versatilis]|uniref:Iron-sulfur cluster assembly scaffold protein n=1 Tax=Candidatus Korobacter versatilis TaxID=658062 RepID=A0A932A6H7_9BACT|nr:iron-sulfur cluster assembly scaffold protein [Candidatus Koribacter versatilis]